MSTAAKQTIVYVIDSQAYGGAERYLQSLLEGLQPSYSIVVINLGAPVDQISQYCSQHGLKYYQLGSGVGSLLKLYRLQKTYSQALWHLNLTHYGSCRNALFLAKGNPDLKVIATIHTLANQPAANLLSWLGRSLFNRLNTVIAPCHFIAEQLNSQRSYPKNKIVVVNNGVQDIGLPTQSRPKSKTVKIITIGRLHPHKGQIFLIDAMADLLSSDSAMYCQIVGQGPLRQQLQQRIDEAGLSESVELLGFSNQPATLLHQADIFVLPSLPDSENFPLSILEAMSAGLPVVATNVGGIKEQVDNGLTGYVVESGSVQSLVDALRSLVEDPQLRQKMAAASRQRYQQHFTLATMIKQTQAVYQKYVS